MDVKDRPPATATGELDAPRTPVPSCPTLPSPQQNAAPDVLSAQLVWFPVVTEARGTILAGTVTVTGAVPMTPSDVAVIVADPAETPVRSPVASTVTTLVFDEVHVTTLSVTMG
jgi:hypothetical protein